jgi:hypothetical protein
VIALQQTKIALLTDYIKLLKNHMALLEIKIATVLRAGPSETGGARAKHKLTQAGQRTD